jgi:hypothetical protein
MSVIDCDSFSCPQKTHKTRNCEQCLSSNYFSAYPESTEISNIGPSNRIDEGLQSDLELNHGPALLPGKLHLPGGEECGQPSLDSPSLTTSDPGIFSQPGTSGHPGTFTAEPWTLQLQASPLLDRAVADNSAAYFHSWIISCRTFPLDHSTVDLLASGFSHPFSSGLLGLGFHLPWITAVDLLAPGFSHPYSSSFIIRRICPLLLGGLTADSAHYCWDTSLRILPTAAGILHCGSCPLLLGYPTADLLALGFSHPCSVDSTAGSPISGSPLWTCWPPVSAILAWWIHQ